MYIISPLRSSSGSTTFGSEYIAPLYREIDPWKVSKRQQLVMFDVVVLASPTSATTSQVRKSCPSSLVGSLGATRRSSRWSSLRRGVIERAWHAVESYDHTGRRILTMTRLFSDSHVKSNNRLLAGVGKTIPMHIWAENYPKSLPHPPLRDWSYELSPCTHIWRSAECVRNAQTKPLYHRLIVLLTSGLL